MPDPVTPAPGAKPGDPPASPPAPGNGVPPAPTTPDEVAKHIKALNEENAQRRHENKALREENEVLKGRFGKIESALASAFGGAAPAGASPEEAVKQIKAQSEERVRRAVLERDAVAQAAKLGARSPSIVVRALDLAGIEVDPESLRVKDEKILGERIEGLRKSDPYLFADPTPPASPAPGAPPAGAKPPTPSPTPGKPDLGGGGEEAIDTWQRLRAAGNRAEAAKFYHEHRADILTALDKRAGGAKPQV